MLIGVAQTPGAPDFDSLTESVAADLEGLRQALESSNYAVHVLKNPGRAQIGATIFELARKVPEDGTFLVYFTGHGLRLFDTDYLLPADALAPPPDNEWSQVYRDSLQLADISRYLEQCRANTVLWLIDACRDKVTEAAFGSRIVQGPPSGGFALMVGCDLGERCGYGPEGSFFTQGLIEAFSSMSTPQTVHEVYEASRSVTARLAAKHGLKQRVQIRYGTDREDETRQTQICAGRHLMDEWRAVVTDERLWRLATPSDQVPRLQEHLLSLVEECARQVQQAEKRLRDPWSDDDFAPRLLLRTLPLIAPEVPCFSVAEVASLVAAVFLHEGAWADKLSQAADTNPYNSGRQQVADVHRRHLEQVHDQYSHVARKLNTLLVKKKHDDCDSAALWLVHRWIGDRFETDEKPIPPGLVKSFAQALLDSSDDGRLDEFATSLSRLAASIGTEPPLDVVPGSTARKLVLLGEKQPFRERPLTALLRLAAALAVDARAFPEVVAEHLGVSDALTPAEVVATVRGSVHWSSDGLTLDMDALCPHQALHAGLEEAADRADRLAALTRKRAEELPESERALLARIPSRVTAGELRPRQVDGQKSYEVPLLRFQLAQNEVRELLMGKQLYGSPDLALRELYQNAMDACRYRAMRWEYLRRTERHPADWTGRISIVQGEDDRGRYVECRDNGVGMAWDQLINTFTRAGSRFEQSRGFRQEQAAWLRFDPTLRLYPNSRFGIGVFSYFMLADEMTIVTRPVSRDGLPAGNAWRVEISSSGSLFRILKHTEADDGVAEGGTRVRLYLRDDSDLKALSVTKTLGSLVAVSEFHLQVRDTSELLLWEPGVLYPKRAHESTSNHVAVPGVLWWVNSDGAILCDGIVTDQNPFGYVLNLTGAHAGELNVNRKTLLSYDEDWERHNWVKGAPEVVTWSGLTMNWLWDLDANNLPVARVVWQALRGQGVQVPETTTEIAYDIDTTGVSWIDRNTFKARQSYGDGAAQYLRPWRLVIFRRPRSEHMETAPRDLVGHPVLEPGYAEICLTDDDETWEEIPNQLLQHWSQVLLSAVRADMTIAEVMRCLRRTRLVHPMFAPPRVLPGDLGWQPEHTDTSLVEVLSGRTSSLGMSESNDLRDLVMASHKLRRPLGELINICARYTPLLLSPPPDVPSHQREYICSDEDFAMLYIVREHERQYVDPFRETRRVTHPADVCEVAKRLGVPTATILDRLGRFSWLGWGVPDAESVNAWADVDESGYSLLRDFTSDGHTLDWAATVVLASADEMTLEEAEDELAELARTIGLNYTRRLGPDFPGGELVPSEEVAALLSNAYKREGNLMSQGFGMEDLARYMPANVPLESYPRIVSELADMSVLTTSYPLLFEAWEELPLRAKYVFSGTGSNLRNDLLTEPRTDVLFVAACELKEPLKDVWRLAETEASKFGLQVPVLPTAVADFRPTQAEVSALLNVNVYDSDDDQSSLEWTPVSMFCLARYAHETESTGRAAYEKLAFLRPIGALVPQVSPAALQVLEKSRPDKRDLLALEGEHRVTKPDEPLVPLDLVSVAARLGEPISETWQRFVPYLPLTVEPAVAHFPDVIPHWQDFAILTKYLDGLLPAIEGRVDPAHVEFVAREVGESEEWVWGRLKLYEAMFDLDLSDMPVGES